MIRISSEVLERLWMIGVLKGIEGVFWCCEGVRGPPQVCCKKLARCLERADLDIRRTKDGHDKLGAYSQRTSITFLKPKGGQGVSAASQQQLVYVGFVEGTPLNVDGGEA